MFGNDARLLPLPVMALICLLLAAACSSSPVDATSGRAGAKILETMNSGGYTYVMLEDGEAASWYAVPECEVAVGDRVEVADDALEMRDFRSSTLQRTFTRIFFAMGLKKVD